MVLGKQIPGQSMMRLCGGLRVVGRGRSVTLSSLSSSSLEGFLGRGLGGDLVMQHRPEPGHTADLSISSHNREKKPVTQVPRHLTFWGISVFFDSDVFMISSSSSLSSSLSSSSFSSIFSFLSFEDCSSSSSFSSSSSSSPSLHLSSSLGMIN